MAFRIEYFPGAIRDLSGLRGFDRQQILDAIPLHLTHQPKQESRSRIKRMSQPFWSEYRLRVGEFRVYYDVDETAQSVNVLRILEKGTAETLKEMP